MKKNKRLEWSGERFLPWMEVGEIHYEHLHRYYFAKEFSKNKSVLDLACGEGYGSFILADSAKKVVGIDKNLETIEHAKNSYIKNNLKFVQGDITSIPIKDEKFDLIVCFEALEHVEQQESLLNEVNKLLGPNGILIISTPNKEFFSDDERSPFHKKELLYNEFKDLLENNFSNVKIGGQNLTLDSNIRYETNSKLKEYVIERKDERYNQGQKIIKDSKFFIGVASRKPLDLEIESSLLVDKKNEVFYKKEEYLKQVGLLVNSKDAEISQLTEIIELKENDPYLKDLEKTIKRKDTEIGQLDGLVKQKDTEIGQLDGLVKQKDTEIGQLDGLVKQKDTEIGQLDGLVKQKDTEIGQLDGLVKQKDTEIGQLDGLVKQKDTEIGQLDGLVKQKDTEIGQLDGLVKQKDTEIGQLDGLVKQKDTEIGQLDGLVKQKDTEIGQLDGLVKQKDTEIGQLDGLVKQKDTEIGQLDGLVKQKDTEIGQLGQLIENQKHEIINLRDELENIKNSIIFKTINNITKKLDQVFPNNSRRGDLRKIITTSASVLDEKGVKKYASEIKTKVSRREFKVLSEMKFSNETENKLIENARRRQRLKLKSHSDSQIANDEFIIDENSNKSK